MCKHLVDSFLNHALCSGISTKGISTSETTVYINMHGIMEGTPTGKNKLPLHVERTYLLSSSVNCKNDMIRSVPRRKPPILKRTKGIGAFPTLPGSALKKFKIPNGFFPINVIEQTNKMYEMN